MAPVTPPPPDWIGGWTAELNQAVETALAQPDPQPPEGVTAGDWERVLQARQADTLATAEQLRRLAPDWIGGWGDHRQRR